MTEKVFIKNKKGLRLAAVLHYPDKNKKYPAVILLHGFTGYKEEGHIEALANDLARNEFVAIRFDASGSGESEGSSEKEYRIESYLKDIEVVQDFLAGLDFVDRQKLFIWGHSLGGSLAIIHSVDNSIIQAVCAVCAPTERTKTNWFKRIIPKWKETGWFIAPIPNRKSLKIPYEAVVDDSRYNSLDFVERIGKPLLMIVGKMDETVPKSQSKALFKKAKSPKFLFEVDMMHNYDLEPDKITVVNTEVIKFFRKYL